MEAGPLVGATEFDEHGNLREFLPGAYVMGLAEIDGRSVADRRRRLHHLRRQPAQRAQAPAPVHATAGDPVRHPVHPIGRRGRPQFQVGRGGRPHGPALGRTVVERGRTADQGSGGGRDHGLGRRRARRVRAHVALHRHGERTVADLPVRPARGAARDRREARQGGLGRRRHARPRKRPGRQRGGLRRGSLRADQAVHLVPAEHHERRRARASKPAIHRTAGRRNCSTSSRPIVGTATTRASSSNSSSTTASSSKCAATGRLR